MTERKNVLDRLRDVARKGYVIDGYTEDRKGKLPSWCLAARDPLTQQRMVVLLRTPLWTEYVRAVEFWLTLERGVATYTLTRTMQTKVKRRRYAALSEREKTARTLDRKAERRWQQLKLRDYHGIRTRVESSLKGAA
jgi:hypothetical protein